MKVPFSPPDIGKDEIKLVTEVLLPYGKSGMSVLSDRVRGDDAAHSQGRSGG